MTPTKLSYLERFTNWLLSVQTTLQALESVIIDLVSIVTPWLSTTVPASMAYDNMIKRLGFDTGTALACAISIECVGLAAINTAIKFRQFNLDKAARTANLPRRKKAAPVQKQSRLGRWLSTTFGIGRKRRKVNGAPFLVATVAGAFYIVIVITVNAILDIGHASTVQIVSKGLLSLITVVSGTIIAIRSSHAQRTLKVKVSPVVLSDSKPTELPKPVDVKPVPETKPVAAKPKSAPKLKAGQTLTKEQYFAANRDRNGQGPIPAKELMERYGVSKSTAYEWVADWKEAQNGHGVQAG